MSSIFQKTAFKVDEEFDYMEHINSMYEYSKRTYPGGDTFAVYFIINLQQCLNGLIEMQKMQPAKKCEIMCSVDKYVHDYFLKRHKPTQTPKLYAIIKYNMSISTNLSSLGKGTIQMQNKIKHESLLYLEDAHKCIRIYEKQLESNNLSNLSQYTDAQYGSFESTLHGKISCSLCRIYFDSGNNKKAIKMVNECFTFYINNQNQYTTYGNTDGVDFITDLIKKLFLLYDCNQKKSYQIKWKYLLKQIIKTLKHFDMALMYDKYGRCLIFLGIYYWIWSENKINKAEKCMTDGINVIKQYDPYSPSLSLGYEYLYELYLSLGNYVSCKNIVNALINIDIHNYGKSDHHDKFKELKSLKRKFKHKTLKSRHEARKRFFYGRNAFASTRVPNGIVKQWTKYFKNGISYQIMKNICFSKECNYFKCKRKDVKLSKCSECNSVYYCSRKHQKMDWKIRHKNECRSFQERNVKFTIQRGWKTNAYYYAD